MKKIKGLILTLVLIIGILFITGCKKSNSDNLMILVSNFPSYDFVRAITKNSNIEIKMLLKPGEDMHDFEPTPQNIIDIEKSDLFIYVGGESDDWITDILEDNNIDKNKIMRLMDMVEAKEEIIEGMDESEDEDEHEHEAEDEKEYDEHVWTSPKNAITIVEKLRDKIISLNKDNSMNYTTNAYNYITEISKLDIQFKNMINSSKRKEIIFGDRFPMRYFTDEYGLVYYAAFKGCSHATEASAKTISFLINKVKEDKIPVVFKIELSNGNIANTISDATGAKVLEFSSLHNISESDFSQGLTYVDIMKKNYDALKEALN